MRAGGVKVRAMTERRYALLLGAMAFAVHCFGVASTPYLLDSAELAAASFGLGVAHPPGEPLALLWGKLWTLLPLGSVAFKVGLSQSAATGIATALVYRLAHMLCTAVASDRPAQPVVSRLLGTVAACFFVFSPGICNAAFRPEVYALATALGLGALALAMTAAERNDQRFAWAAAFLIGLGLCNHPLVAAAAGVGAAVASIPLLRGTLPRLQVVLGSVASLVLGLGVLLYLPLRTMALSPGANVGSLNTIVWGDSRTASGLWWVLSGRTFADKATFVHGRDDAASLPFLFVEELGRIGLFLALVGFYVLLRKRTVRTAAVGPIFAVGCVLFGAAVVGGIDPSNPDIRGYLGVVIGIGCAMVAIGVQFSLWILRQTRWQTIGAVSALVLALALASRGWASKTLHNVQVADRFAFGLLHGLPPRAVYLTAHYETAFLMSYLRGVEGQRPDVAWVHLGWNRGPGYAERVEAALPELAPLMQSHRHGPLSLESVSQLSMRRPVFLDPAIDMTAEFGRKLVRFGNTWQLNRGGKPDPFFDVPWVVRTREERAFVAYHHYLNARLACRNGEADARTLVMALLAIVPEDATALELARRCLRQP